MEEETKWLKPSISVSRTSFQCCRPGPALICSSHSQYSLAAHTTPAARAIHPFHAAMK